MRKIINSFLLSFLFCAALNAQPLTPNQRNAWIASPIDNSFSQLTLGSTELPWGTPSILYFGAKSNLDGLQEEYYPLLELQSAEDNRYLSNYFPKEIIVDGRPYKTSEHYYHAMKFEMDGPIYLAIIDAPTPADAKTIAWTNASSAKLGDDQEMSSRMKRALWGKFVSTDGYPNELGQRLIATQNQLIVEGNRRFTGAGLNISDKRWGMEFDFTQIPESTTLKGQNLLGKLLMELRTILQQTHL